MNNGKPPTLKEADGHIYGPTQLRRDLPHLLSDVARERAHLAKLPRPRACRCEQPWIERDPELGVSCLKCGRGWKP